LSRAQILEKLGLWPIYFNSGALISFKWLRDLRNRYDDDILELRITLLYVIIIAILLSPYVVFTWGVGDTDGALTIIVIYALLALFAIYISLRSNRSNY
jgi:hypothetical protein